MVTAAASDPGAVVSLLMYGYFFDELSTRDGRHLGQRLSVEGDSKLVIEQMLGNYKVGVWPELQLPQNHKASGLLSQFAARRCFCEFCAGCSAG